MQAPGSLRPPADETARAKLREATRGLETLVLKNLVTTSKAFTGGEGAGSEIRAGMFADALADAMVKGGGIGLAAQLERSLTPGGQAPQPRSVPGGLHRGGVTRSLAFAPRGPVGAASTPARGSLPASPGPGDVPPTRTRATPEPLRVTSPFGPRHDPFDGRLTRHAGVDLAMPEGAEVRAVAGGVVRRAGELGGYGSAVEIDHGGGVTTVYAHASELLVGEGDRVIPGQAVARAGHSGRATGDHLHFEVRQGGKAVDPSRALKIYARRADEVDGSGP